MGEEGLPAAVLRQIVARHPEAALLVREDGTIESENAEASALAPRERRASVEIVRTDLAGEGLTIVLLRDVSERNAMRAELVADLAHEIATPLHTLGLALDILPKLDAGMQEQALDDARVALRQVRGVIAALRLSARAATT